MTGIIKNRKRYSINKREFVVYDFNVFIKRILFHWPLLLFIIALSIGAGIYYTTWQKPKFKSHLTFILNDNRENDQGNFLSIAARFGLTSINSGNNIFAGNNLAEIIKSRRIIENVLLSTDTFNNRPYRLIEYFLEISNYRTPTIKDIHYPVDLHKGDFSYRQDSLLYEVFLEFRKKYVEVKRPNKVLDIYEVSVTSGVEKFTKLFTERIVGYTYNYYGEIRTSKTKNILDVFEQRSALMKASRDYAIGSEGPIQDENLNPVQSSANAQLAQKKLNSQIYQAAYNALFSNMQLARLDYLKKTPLMQIIDGADYPMEEIKLRRNSAILLFPFFSLSLFIFILWLWRIFGLSNIESARMYYQNFKEDLK